MKIHKIFTNGNSIIIILFLAFLLICPVHAEGFGLYISNQSVTTGMPVTVPVMITNAEELGEVSIEISYDPAVLKFSGADSGNVSKNGIIESSEIVPGTVLINFEENSGISQNGEIMKLAFDVPGAEGSSSQIRITPKKIQNLDKNDVPADVRGGLIQVTGTGHKTPVALWITVLALIVIVLVTLKRK
jgi:hypothetical protein